MVFLTFGEADMNFDWIFRGAVCKIKYKNVSYYNFNRIIEIVLGKAARFAKSETTEYRGDCYPLYLTKGQIKQGQLHLGLSQNECMKSLIFQNIPEKLIIYSFWPNLTFDKDLWRSALFFSTLDSMNETTTPCFIHLRLFFRKLFSFFALGTIHSLCKQIFRLSGPHSSYVSMVLGLWISAYVIYEWSGTI